MSEISNNFRWWGKKEKQAGSYQSAAEPANLFHERNTKDKQYKALTHMHSQKLAESLRVRKATDLRANCFTAFYCRTLNRMFQPKHLLSLQRKKDIQVYGTSRSCL